MSLTYRLIVSGVCRWRQWTKQRRRVRSSWRQQVARTSSQRSTSCPWETTQSSVTSATLTARSRCPGWRRTPRRRSTSNPRCVLAFNHCALIQGAHTTVNKPWIKIKFTFTRKLFGLALPGSANSLILPISTETCCRWTATSWATGATWSFLPKGAWWT